MAQGNPGFMWRTGESDGPDVEQSQNGGDKWEVGHGKE